jgi:hypothetical protein
VSSFTFMHSNRQRCEIDQTIFVMVDPNFQATNVSEMAWIAESCWGKIGGPVGRDVKPTQVAKSRVTTQL